MDHQMTTSKDDQHGLFVIQVRDDQFVEVSIARSRNRISYSVCSESAVREGAGLLGDKAGADRPLIDCLVP